MDCAYLLDFYSSTIDIVWRIGTVEGFVHIGVLTVPINIAQEITDKMIAGGIKAVWNFTPFRIRVPENIVVQNTSLYAHLAVMFNRLNVIQE